MNNNLVLPLLALILTVLSALFPLSSGGDAAPNRSVLRSGAITSAIAILLFAMATLIWPQTYTDGVSIALALAIGAVVGVIASGASMASRGFAVGLAVLGASALHFDFISATAIAATQIAFVTGTFIGAFSASGVAARTESGNLCVVASLMVVSIDSLGRSATNPTSAVSWAGVVLGLCFLLANLVVGLAGKSAKSPVVLSGVGFVVLALTGYLACWKFLDSSTSANLWFSGAVVGGVVHLLLAGETKPESFRFVLSTVIWLGAATVAFAMDKGYGMAITTFGGAGTLILMGDIRGLMTLGVAAAILVYRLFREMFPSEARALDIGQHYTMIGLAIGALLPLLPIEWGRDRLLKGWREGLTNAMWLLVLAGLPIGGAMLLGSKGAIGMVVGLSLAAVVEGLRGVATLATLAISAGIGGLTILSYRWLGDWADLEHGAKVHAVWVISGLALALAAAFFALTRNQATEPAKQ